MGCHQSKLRRRSVPVQGGQVVVEEGVLSPDGKVFRVGA